VGVIRPNRDESLVISIFMCSTGKGTIEEVEMDLLDFCTAQREDSAVREREDAEENLKPIFTLICSPRSGRLTGKPEVTPDAKLRGGFGL
jgi:hypothetical protein